MPGRLHDESGTGKRRIHIPAPKSSLLIVDDDGPIRRLMSAILTGAGYEVRTAEDGFEALQEIRTAMPDLVLSDLYMPSMSGFEFLSVIRRRFPAIRVIAMSSAFAGGQIPSGIAADAFYEKGTNVAALLRIVEATASLDDSNRNLAPDTPMWIQSNSHDPAGTPCVMITCPECLRSFAQVTTGPLGLTRSAECFHCASPLYYAVILPGPPAIHASIRNLQQRLADAVRELRP